MNGYLAQSVSVDHVLNGNTIRVLNGYTVRSWLDILSKSCWSMRQWASWSVGLKRTSSWSSHNGHWKYREANTWTSASGRYRTNNTALLRLLSLELTVATVTRGMWGIIWKVYNQWATRTIRIHTLRHFLGGEGETEHLWVCMEYHGADC